MEPQRHPNPPPGKEGPTPMSDSRSEERSRKVALSDAEWRSRLTPEQYRNKWGLPADYPMVAPNYAAKRSALAKKMGLGRRRKPGPRKRRRG